MIDRLQVLVVDAEAKMRQGISHALETFEVELPDFHRTVKFGLAGVATSEAALDYLRQQPVDLVLLSHQPPRLHALELLQQVTAEKRDTVVVVLAAHASLATAVGAGRRGAYAFLARPFTAHELLEVVEKAATNLIVQRQARRLEQERHQLRFQFISVVAHELKAPLNAIESYLRLLTDPTVAIDQQQLGHAVERSLFRLDGMRKLIDDLLDLTRIESGQRRRNLAELDLCRVVQRPLETVQPLASEHGVTLITHLPASLPLVADESELEIILNNLLTNAVKYNRPGGRAELTLRQQEGEVAIVVSDTGIGIAPADADRLFRDFVRLKNPQTRDIPGSGLGLAIVKKLAVLYGGTVKLESAPGVGSTFTVTLRQTPVTPVAPAPALAAAPVP
jgi:signal transduction histidine kinase